MATEKPNEIRHWKKRGKLTFDYSHGSGLNYYYKGNFESFGTVPQDIAKEGKSAVENYVTECLKERDEKIKRCEARYDDVAQNHVPVRAVYEDGTLLEGRIVEANASRIRVELDKPLKGNSNIRFGFASAIAGRHIWEGDEISEHGLDGTRRALCWAYENALNADVIALADVLNKGNVDVGWC